MNYSSSHLFYIVILVTLLQATKSVNIYSGETACSQKIVLGTERFSGIIDFWHEKHMHSSNFTCSFRIETLPRSHVALNFLSSPKLNTYSQTGCEHLVTIESSELNIEQCNSFPQTELSSIGFVNISYHLNGVHLKHQQNGRFKMIFFTYSLSYGANMCRNNETLCVGSDRCIYEPLKCLDVYDFCNNGLESCQNITDRATLSTQAVPLTGLYIFLACSFFTLGLTFYTCVRKGLHLCECTCHCCSTIERTGSDTQSQSRQTGNGNAEDQVVITTSVRRVISFSNEDNASSIVDVNFDLPPSYSYIERSRDNASIQDVATYGRANEGGENNLDIIQHSSTELPPSYSTVLGHEEEYDVHVY